MHHDKDFAVHRNGTRDIFLNTPNQAAWFERFVTDWTGPHGRLQRMTFRMLGSIFPGDTMVFDGTVTETGVDDTGCGWVASTSRCRSTATPRPRARPGWPCRSPPTTTRGTARATGGDPEPAAAPAGPAPAHSHTTRPQTQHRTTQHQKRSTDHVGPQFQRRAGDAPRDGAWPVRHHQPLQRGARAAGRPDRLLGRPLEAARPPRPPRPAAAGGVRGLGDDRGGGRRPLRGVRPVAGPLAPLRERRPERWGPGPGRAATSSAASGCPGSSPGRPS